MTFQVGIENNNDGRSIAWALEHPGCFAYGANADEAVLNLESAFIKYAGWILRYEAQTWLNLPDAKIEFVINGIWDVYTINDGLDKTTDADGYSVESFFPYDWKPLPALEIKHGLAMLTWSREDLLNSVVGLSPAKSAATYPGERWSINGILGHVGGAEWWYLDQLGLAFPREQVPDEPLARLEIVRKQLVSALLKLEGVQKVIGVSGEFWSPRKILRRALWHERDHCEHIRKLL